MWEDGRATLSYGPVLPHRGHAHRHLEPLAAGGEDAAVDRRDVGVVATDREHDVIVAGEDAVGGVEPAPARLLAAPHQHPGMHGIGAGELVLGGLPPP